MWIKKIDKLPTKYQICDIRIAKTGECFESGMEAKSVRIKEIQYCGDGIWFKEGDIFGSSVYKWKINDKSNTERL